MSWLTGIGAGLSVLGNEMTKREDQKRSQEDRLRAIRDKLSLVNAQAPEKKRVIPGQELPADVAGPPAPEMVETFKTSLEYDPERGYVAKDEVIGSQRNQWSTTDKTAKEAGGKIYKKTTEMDLAGNQRTNFDEEDAAQKLKKERILQGDQMVDVMMNESGEIVNELGRGGRYRPASAGRSPEEMRADADYRHNLTMERERERQRLNYENDVARSAGAAMGDWREMNARQREAYNAGLGLPPDAREQDVRNALRKRIIEDRSTPPDQARKDTEALLSSLPQDKPAKAAAEPEIGVNPDAAELMRRAQKAKGNSAEKSDLWKGRDQDAEPFKRKPGDPEPEPNPMAKDDPKPKGAEKPADKPKDEPKKEEKKRMFEDDETQKDFDEDVAKFERLLKATRGEKERAQLQAEFRKQLEDVYNVSFK